ncbi:hypothetical protein CC78DRAFT_535065 [Lojkania enalia]|uniref:CCCH zinc finger and RRM domain-containing protein n=1 Tax=Lojkania enalia TaxID=147567 RepID=A0A9P4K6I8_9PLEO|nr:hypothetical protein CC78DRAFT_535065 [Didymosphaeria enalia]
MLVDEADKPAFKQWVVPKLETISDADADVLADYVIALVGAEESEAAVKQNCLDNLPDFLHEHTGPFIEEVLQAAKTKSYLPHPKPAAPQAVPASARLPSPALSTEVPPFNPPSGPAISSNRQQRIPGLGNGTSTGRERTSRKRSYNDRETSQTRDGQDPHKRGAAGDRPLKQTARRGGRNSRGGFSGQEVAFTSPPGIEDIGYNLNGQVSSIPSLPTPPAGFPAFNPADPMTTFLTMAAALGMGFPGMPPLPLAGPSLVPQPPSTTSHPVSKKERCKDYDTKGFCVLGSVCPYEHGGEILMPQTADGTYRISFSPLSSLTKSINDSGLRSIPETTDDAIPEYDPNKASLALDARPRAGGNPRGVNRNETGSRKRFNGNRSRAPFSHTGPTSNRSNTTVVVEQIPEANFSEEDVRQFFSQFGNIVEVQMQAYKHLAIVKYDDHFAARRAYDNPKVIFDNRFVKVYWYKPESLPVPPAKAPNGAIKAGSPIADYEDRQQAYNQDEEMLDPEEVERRQADAQKAFEERQKKVSEAEARRLEVEQQLKANNEEMIKIREQLAKRTGIAPKVHNGEMDVIDEAGLIDRLALLQEEAQNLNFTAENGSHWPRGRGSGLYRGRRYHAPRGRGHSFRGSYRGRGFAGPPFGGGRSGVKRLDNRPRRIAVADIKAGSLSDEALRQFLLNAFDFESIDPHPDRPNTQIITFKERYVAEMFLDASLDIPELGKVDCSWVSNTIPIAPETAVPAVPAVSTTVKLTETEKPDQPVPERDINMEEESKENKEKKPTITAEETTGNNINGEADYDVADDEDRWIAP